MSKLVKLLALLVLAWVFGSGLFAADSARVLDKSFSGAKNITIKLTSGDCRLHPAAGKEVRVRNETTLPEDRFLPEARQDGEQVVVTESYPGSGWTRGKVEWDIWVPAGMAISFRSASGDLEANKLVNPITIRTASGDVELRDVTGELKAQTASGDIVLENGKGTAGIRSASGDVVIRGGEIELTAASASGDVEINSTSGSIKVRSASGDIELSDVKGSGSIQSASGEVEVKGLTANGAWEMSAVSGSVLVRLAKTAGHDMALSSVSGSVLLDYKGHALKGKFEVLAATNRGEIRSSEKGDRDTVFVKGTKFDRLSFSRGDSPHIKLKTHSGTAEIRR